MKNKGFNILMFFYVIMMCLDIWSTLRLKELAGVLETNPIYKFIGFPGLIILNLLSIYILYKLYNNKKSTPRTRFLILTSIFLIGMVRIVAVQGNLSWEPGEITVEQAEKLATPEFKQANYIYILLMYCVPFIYILIPFFLWSLDHKTKKEDENG